MLIINSKTDINIQDNGCGYTLLMMAAMNNQIDIIKELLKHPNIDLTLQTKEYGLTVFDLEISDEVRQLL